MNGLDLFSGIGGLSVALRPWVRTIAYCDNDRFAQAVLLSRMAEGALDFAPIWDNVRTLTRTVFDERVDIVFGGFPCTDLSSASHGKGAGLQGDESGLWYEMLRIVQEYQPRYVFIENVAGAARGKWLPHVQRDLGLAGYESQAMELAVNQIGGPFKGSRVYLAAAHSNGESAGTVDGQAPLVSELTEASEYDWGTPPPQSVRVDDGVPNGLDRLRGLGNAVVPAQAREAFQQLMGYALG